MTLQELKQAMLGASNKHGVSTELEAMQEAFGTDKNGIKTLLKSANIAVFEANISNAYPLEERLSFERQRQEALTWQKSKKAGTLLKALATKRNESLDDLSAKILTKATAYDKAVETALAQKQALEKEIEGL